MTWTVPLFDDVPEPARPDDTAPTAAPLEAPTFEVVVRGLPGPQGSKRHVGNGRMVESSAKVKPWREAVVWSAVQARRAIKGSPTLDGPLAAEMVFCFARPRGHFGTGRNAGRLRPSAPARPAVTPDLSKLARSTEDALTTAAVNADDALIVEYRRLGKWYVTDHGLVDGVLDGPGCTIRLWRLNRGAVGA
ncbi:RusA family crossover junction endodeoxyribonuclease [Streptomyces sp. DH12]|uniref:RusA family crossover junction endodeoxyribonuclease n=1 Tax=Streptomyces sp. DH12 TaxID=2857010 RepID=UPI001E4A4DC7|nr:RusA family crossover junction endodeoxyribonuclease [Streptomyces sp. DH12]